MEIVLGIGALVAIVWLAVAWRYGKRLALNPIAVGGVATVLVGTVFGHAFFHTDVGPVPVTFDRLLLGGVFLFFLIRFFLGEEGVRRIDRTDIVVLALIGLLTMSTLTHDWRFRDNLPLSQLLFFVFLPTCLYFVSKNCNLSDRDLKFTYIAFAVLGVYLSLTAFAETRDWTWAVFPRYISDPEITEFLGRGRGPLLNPVSNGLLIILGISCSFLLIPHVRNQPYLVGLAVAAVAIGVLGAYSTLTRIIWLGSLVALFFLTWAPLSKYGKIAFGSISVIVALLIVLVVSTGALTSFKRDKHVSVYDMSKSAGLRVVFFVIAKDMFADKPVFGHGFGQYRQAKMDYLHEPTEGNVETALGKSYIQHNIVLSFLTETGLVGAVMLLCLLGTFASIGWTLWADPVSSLAARQMGLLLFLFVGVFFIAGMVQDVSVVPMANSLLYLLAGLTSNLYSRRAMAANPSVANVPPPLLATAD